MMAQHMLEISLKFLYFSLVKAAVLLSKISQGSNLLIPWERFSISLSMASYLNPHQKQRQCAW